MNHPYVHTWTEDGIQRQAQIHLAVTGSEVVWDAHTPGDSHPWQDLDNDRIRYSDDEITTR